MKPIEFEQVNIRFAKDQPEYRTLPAYKDSAGEVISCWGLTWKDRFTLLFTGKLWLRVYTFNDSLQPQLPCVENPWSKK